MSDEKILVVFQPEERAVKVDKGTLLVDAAEKAGILLSVPCGKIGKCGKCKIKILDKQIPFTEEELYWLSPVERENNVHLACQIKVVEPLITEVISEEKAEQANILTYDLANEYEVDHHLKKIFVRFQKPDLENQIDDYENLQRSISREIQDVKLPLLLLQNLPQFLRKNDFQATVVLGNEKIVSLESGDTTERVFGIAVDLGTTTVVGSLVDMRNGNIVAVAARTNPQARQGADVISRVKYATSEPGGLSILQSAAKECINEIIDELCEKSGVNYREIYEMSLAGNTIMNHLFLGVSPQYIAEAPYIPAFRKQIRFRADELGITIQPRGSVITLPNISGYVGGDIVGFILASGIHQTDKLTLGIDIGTNGEIVLGNRERLLACSAAAGPAFEGGKISCGMRAEEGAIDKFAIGENEFFYHVIGDVEPKGICGTALVDIVAEFLKSGIINETGRFVIEDNEKIAEWLKMKFYKEENKSGIIIAESSSNEKPPVQVTQQDIRELQLGKGAIAAGIEILCKEMGVSTNDIEQVIIAGAFGSFLNKSNAQKIGLIPDIPLEKVSFVGNAASLGAKKFLLSLNQREQADKIVEFAEYIELSTRLDFQEVFADKMFFKG